MAKTFDVGGQVRLIWWRALVQPFRPTTYAEMCKVKRIGRKLRLTESEEADLEAGRPDIPKDPAERTATDRAADKTYAEWIDEHFRKRISSLDDDYVQWLKEQVDKRLAENSNERVGQHGGPIGWPMGEYFMDAADLLYELTGAKPGGEDSDE